MGCVLRKILNLILFPCFRMPNIRTTIQSLEARHKIKIFSIVKVKITLISKHAVYLFLILRKRRTRSPKRHLFTSMEMLRN